MPPALAASNEDNIALAGIRILILEEEEVLNPIIAQCGSFDDDAEGTGQALLDNQVLLASDLERGG